MANFMGIFIGRIVLFLRTRQLCLILITILFSSYFSFAQTNIITTTLLPGAKVYDVTKPEAWGGTLGATPNNSTDDDALAINQAIQVAANFISKNSKNNDEVFQQVILIPKGDYHLESTIILPRTNSNRENAIWIYGEGSDKSRFILKSADKIGQFGLPDQPKPLIQYAPYTYDKEGAGNTNFQLWATDYAIIIPNDQPNAVGISYGCANMGGVRNLFIKAEGNAGHTGLAMIQYNNGPGWVENVTIEGFNTGIEVSDGWGETFSFCNIKLRNQNRGGIGISIADKMIAIEGLSSEQQEEDITPVLLYDNDSFNSEFGGAPHLTLLNSSFYTKNKSVQPVLQIKSGHCFIRNLNSQGYGDLLINDHGVDRIFTNGQIKGEYISVHGKTAGEEKNVLVTFQDSPTKSINLPLPATPEICQKVWDKISSGNYTLVNQSNLNDGNLVVKTDWVIVDPSKADDDTKLLQAALNSGARYVGLLNNQSFHISKNIVVNRNKGKVELIFGYMSEILVDKNLRLRENMTVRNNKTLFTLETGSAKSLTIKGIRIIADDGNNSDMLLFQNNSSQQITFEDIRCKDAPRGYRNGKESYGKQVFFENVEFAYNGIHYDVIMQFDKQKVTARQFNLEAPILIAPIKLDDKEYKRFSILPRFLNDGSQIAVLSQKLGELNGVYVETTNGGKTEMLSAYFNSGRTLDNSESKDITNFIVSGKNSDFCLVGQERIRTEMMNNLATLPLPNKNKYGIVISEGKEHIIEATSLPTYLKYKGFDPFNDTDYQVNDSKNHIRMTGLFRARTK